MEINIDKYLKVKKGTPTSERAEQIDHATKILGDSHNFKKVAGLTSHLSVDFIFRLNKESKNAPQLWWWLLKNKYMRNPEAFKQNPDYLLMIEKLKTNVDFRERSKRHVGLTILALRTSYAVEENKGKKKPDITLQDVYPKRILTINEISEYAKKFAIWEGWWRKVLEQEENSDLRGRDFLSQAELEKINTRK